MAKTFEHFPVFVSSTFEDLQPYRDAVRNVLIRLETIVKGMEYFGSRPGSPVEECLNVVSNSRVFICIVGMKYGSVDEETGKSMVELEYEKAQELGMPALTYIIDESKQAVLPINFDMGSSAEKLVAFKERLKNNHLVSFFTTPENLAMKISQDLPTVLREIGIDIKLDIKKEILKDKDALKIIKTFQMRPSKAVSQQIIITIKLEKNQEFFTANPTECNAYDLPLGDAFRFTAQCLVAGNEIDKFNIYAHGEAGDWIEENWQKRYIFDAIVRFAMDIRPAFYKIRGQNVAEKILELYKAIIVTDIV